MKEAKEMFILMSIVFSPLVLIEALLLLWILKTTPFVEFFQSWVCVMSVIALLMTFAAGYLCKLWLKRTSDKDYKQLIIGVALTFATFFLIILILIGFTNSSDKVSNGLPHIGVGGPIFMLAVSQAFIIPWTCISYWLICKFAPKLLFRSGEVN